MMMLQGRIKVVGSTPMCIRRLRLSSFLLQLQYSQDVPFPRADEVSFSFSLALVLVLLMNLKFLWSEVVGTQHKAALM